jgi:hypothetical protein
LITGGLKLFVDKERGFLYSNTMTNDFSNIPAESNLRDEMTVASNEVGYGDELLEMAYEDRTHVDDNTTDEVDESLAEDPRMYPGEEMDGDFDSGMASAGLGTDEDYGYYGGDEGE